MSTQAMCMSTTILSGLMWMPFFYMLSTNHFRLSCLYSVAKEVSRELLFWELPDILIL